MSELEQMQQQIDRQSVALRRIGRLVGVCDTEGVGTIVAAVERLVANRGEAL